LRFDRGVILEALCEHERPVQISWRVAGLHYLKLAYACSGESVVKTRADNPYWQRSIGETDF